jgi:ssDNA-binding replication factor A large subunit
MANSLIRTGITLKAVKWSQVEALDPDSKGVNLIVKVVSLKDPEDTKSGTKVQEFVVGDNTGIVTLRLTGDEIEAASKEGTMIEVRNAVVRMLKGFVKLQVGKWGKVSKHEGGQDVTPKKEKDLSAVEYELVQE